MSTRDAAGLLGMGFGLGAFVGGVSSGGSSQRRRDSSLLLAQRLKQSGVSLVTAELGRTPSGPAWVLTLQAPDQTVVTVNVRLSADQDPHSSETADEVVQRVVAHLARPKTG